MNRPTHGTVPGEHRTAPRVAGHLSGDHTCHGGEQTRRQRIQHTLEVFDVMPFDVPAAEYYGALATLVRQHGRNPRARRMDLQIAATAARYGLSLLTRNADDFAGLDSAVTVIDLS